MFRSIISIFTLILFFTAIGAADIAHAPEVSCTNSVVSQCEVVKATDSNDTRIDLPGQCYRDVEVNQEELDYVSDDTIECASFNRTEFSNAVESVDTAENRSETVYDRKNIFALVMFLIPVCLTGILVKRRGDARHYLGVLLTSFLWIPSSFAFFIIFAPKVLNPLLPIIAYPLGIIALAKNGDINNQKILPSLLIYLGTFIFYMTLLFLMQGSL